MIGTRIFFSLLFTISLLKTADQYDPNDMRRRHDHYVINIREHSTGKAKKAVNTDTDAPCCSKCGAATVIVATTATVVTLYQCPVHCLICTSGLCVSCALTRLQNCSHDSCHNTTVCCEICCCPPKKGVFACLFAGLFACRYYCAH